MTALRLSASILALTLAVGPVSAKGFRFAVGSSAGIVIPPTGCAAGVNDVNDGYGSAPAGSPNNATALNGYSTTPNRCASGIDYHTGYPAGQTFTAWDAYSHAGFSLMAAPNHGLRCDNIDNVTLTGIDFTADSGGILYLNGCHNIRVTASKFGSGANLTSAVYLIQQVGTSAGLTVDRSTFGYGGSSGVISVFANAQTVDFEYNDFEGYRQHIIELGNGQSPCNSPPAITSTIRWNYIAHPNITGGGHQNWEQLGCGVFTPDVEYNTAIVDSGGGEGWQYDCTVNCTVQNPILKNNISIALGSNAMSNLAHGTDVNGGAGGVTTLSGTGHVTGNYCDPRGLIAGGRCFYVGSFANWADHTGNTNMNDGTAITP